MIRFARLLPAVPALLAVAACDRAAAPPEATASTAAATEPETKPGLALSGGRLVLPAVQGNPGAVYFALSNGSDKPVAIAAVDVAGAGMAMLHETMEEGGHSTMGEMKDPAVAPGQTLTLAPGGRHVMVFDVPATLKPGGTVEMTLTFDGGDKLSAPLAIEAPGGGN